MPLLPKKAPSRGKTPPPNKNPPPAFKTPPAPFKNQPPGNVPHPPSQIQAPPQNINQNTAQPRNSNATQQQQRNSNASQHQRNSDPPLSIRNSNVTQQQGNIDTAQKVQDNIRTSIEHEYLFDLIPKQRPETPPVAKKSQVFEDSKRHSGGYGLESKEGTIPFKDPNLPVQNEGEVQIGRYDLYKEAMYTGMHMLGAPSPQRFPSSQEQISLYVHEVFSENSKEQDAVLNHVRNEPFPLTIVNTRVKRATGLHGSKAHGFVDPYCVVTIETEDSSVVFQLGQKDWQEFSTSPPTNKGKDLNKLRSRQLRPPAQRRTSQLYEKVPNFIKTSLERHNDNPKWDQRFQCLALRPSIDKLAVEVWDHSIDDKYVAKAIRNSDPSGNLDTTLKSAHTNAERKKGDIFLGKVSIRVADIPCDGSDQWYYLMNPDDADVKSHKHGKLRIQLWLVQAYRHGMHYVELANPRIILAHFWDWVLKHEWDKSGEGDKWDGTISFPATCFLFQYALQNGISEDTHAIIRWNAYAKLDLNLHAVQGRLQDLNDTINKHVAKEEPNEEPIFKKVESSKPPSPILPPKHIRDSQTDIIENIMDIVANKIVPVIRNHLNEEVSTVHEALKSYHECEELLAKFNRPDLIEFIKGAVHSALRMGILEWYEHVYNSLVPTHGDVKKSEYVASVVKVMKEVNTLLGSAMTKWNPEFFLMASLEYFPVVYDELQKMVIHDIEAICWIFFQTIGDYKGLRKILLGNEEKDRDLSREFFELYVQTQTFTTAWTDKIPNGIEGFCCIGKYDRWFRPTVILWLGFALIRGSMMISKAIAIDNNIPEDAHSMTSSSALDTATVFHQLIKFWEALKWPDVAEAFVIINFLTEVMCSYTILYAEMKHAKLDREGYYDPRGKFTISEKLCTAINNIEHVKEHALQIPKEIDHSKLVAQLHEACGKSDVIEMYQLRITERLDKTVEIVNRHLQEIMESVGLLIRKEITGFIDATLHAVLEAGSEQLDEAVAPIMTYLEDNINTLDQALLPYNCHQMLKLFWNLVCHGITICSTKFKMDNFDNQYIFFRKIQRAVTILEHYFEGGDAGLSKQERDTEQFRAMHNILEYFATETDELIGIYYHDRAQFYMNYVGEGNFGTIKVRVGYWNEKLCVEVISATDLTPHDEPLTVLKYFKKMYPTSDAMVELELRPSKNFPEEKKQSTKVMWKNLNPLFEETFYWKISMDDCLKPSAMLVITVKDYDLLTKNAFLGETIIPLHSIPGISKNPMPQPMNLILHEVDNTNPILTVMRSRPWDDTARLFADDQLSRFVEPVIARKIKT